MNSTELTCPKCVTRWNGEARKGVHGQCKGCGTWLVVDYPQTLGKPLRLFAYKTASYDKKVGVTRSLRSTEPSVVIECPFCGVLHEHGGFGYRVPHCSGAVTVPRHGIVQLIDREHGRGYDIQMQGDAPVAMPV
ncbi:hypothetical protein [Humibacter sp.]|uniref:hypothetical protein n=1 Tax=Humibacter sp. TaxID=1940291 RepID=UPI003F7FCA20